MDFIQLLPISCVQSTNLIETVIMNTLVPFGILYLTRKEGYALEGRGGKLRRGEEREGRGRVRLAVCIQFMSPSFKVMLKKMQI